MREARPPILITAHRVSSFQHESNAMCVEKQQNTFAVFIHTIQYTPTRDHTQRTSNENSVRLFFVFVFSIKTCIQWLESLHFTTNSRRNHILTLLQRKTIFFNFTAKICVFLSEKFFIHFSFAINSVHLFLINKKKIVCRWILRKLVTEKLCVKTIF